MAEMETLVPWSRLAALIEPFYPRPAADAVGHDAADSLHAAVVWLVKRQYGFVKVRYRGLAKNTGQIVTLFALANLWMARKRLLLLLGEVRP